MAKKRRLRIGRAMLLGALAVLSVQLSTALPAAAGSDPQIASLPDSGNNIVMGVGLVVGLPGTGDSDVDAGFVERSIVGVLRRAGLELWPDQIKPGRVAKVVVSAQLPANPSRGTHLVVSIAAIGNAASLAGGTLLATPLRDLNGNLYAIGQGSIAAGGQLASDVVVDRGRAPVLASE